MMAAGLTDEIIEELRKRGEEEDEQDAANWAIQVIMEMV